MWTYPRPEDWQLFEEILADWARYELGDTGADRYGRIGQRQDGIDILARNRNTPGGGLPEIWAIQAKRYVATALSPADAQTELERAISHSPRPDVFVLATTTPRDTKLQDWAVGPHRIRVDVWFWDGIIEQLLTKRWFRDKYLAGFWDRRIPRQIAPPPSDFTGRDSEIADLVTQIENGKNVVVVSGMPGIGKTVLALALADRLSRSYPEGQLRVDLRGLESKESLSATDVMLRIIRSFEPNCTVPENSDELVGICQTLIRDRRVLILLDNARDADQLEGLIPPSGSCLVITARQSIVLPGAYKHKMHTLESGDSVHFLSKLCERAETQAHEISELCGRLPLALRLAGSAMEERADLAVHVYMEQLREERTRRGFVDATVEVSYRCLPDQLQHAWRLQSVFGSSYDLRAAAAVLGQDERIASDMLGGLLRHNMLEWDSAYARYAMHDLLRLVAHSRLSVSESEEARLRHAGHYQNVLGSIKKRYRIGNEATTDALLRFDRDRFHIEAAIQWVCTKLAEGDGYRRLCSSYLDAGVDIFPLRMRPETLAEWLEAAVVAARSLHDKPSIRTHLGNLGSAFAGAGNYAAAARTYDEALTMYRAAGDPKGVNSVLGNLAALYLHMGEHSKCIEVAIQSLSMERSIGNKKGMAADLNTLGCAYRRIGDHDKAIVMHSQSLAIKTELGDRLGAANALANLGATFLIKKELDAATRCLYAAIDIYHELGYDAGEHEARGWLCWAVLAFGAIGLLRPEQRADLVEEGLRMDPRLLAEQVIHDARETAANARKEGRNIEYAAILGDIGSLQLALGHSEKAIETQDKSIAAAEECGAEQVQANAQFNKAVALGRLGHEEDAVACMQVALGLYEKLGLPDHRDARHMIMKFQRRASPERQADVNNIGVTTRRGVGRNERCPCGSGKKYKFCCLGKR